MRRETPQQNKAEEPETDEFQIPSSSASSSQVFLFVAYLVLFSFGTVLWDIVSSCSSAELGLNPCIAPITLDPPALDSTMLG